MERLTDAKAVARRIVEATDGDVRLALPLGIGKPITLANALVDLACEDRSVRLSIFTALTLEPPTPSPGIETRFLEPATDRLFGAYPPLRYAQLLRSNALPENIQVSEFFLMAGRWLGVEAVQQAYIAANYTHALDVLVASHPNVLAQLVAEEDGAFSLSCNTDISTDLFRLREEGTLEFLAVGETNPQLPFMPGEDAVLDPGAFRWMLDPPEPFELFSAAKRPVDHAAHAIGLHVSRLIEDDGTLQIGIGSIGDAIAHAIGLRHGGEAQAIQADCPFPVNRPPGGPFANGLYACTEMLVGGLLDLFERGVVSREVDGAAIHAGFFVETRDFYRKLGRMPIEKRQKIKMKPVSFTNQLYGNETAKRSARRHARFVNGAMQVSLLGDAMSDTIADGQVVSGVGGQFNFVEQAFALDDGRSIITLPATRQANGRVESNIRWTIAMTTVPRHMRDIVVTEYGVADLRGKTDAEVIASLIEIADGRFQSELVQRAKEAGKLPENYRLPDAAARNLPETLDRWLNPHAEALPEFPLGTDFDEIEKSLLPALQRLAHEAAGLRGKVHLVVSAFSNPPHPLEAKAMQRMGFRRSTESFEAVALRGALRLVASD